MLIVFDTAVVLFGTVSYTKPSLLPAILLPLPWHNFSFVAHFIVIGVVRLGCRCNPSSANEQTCWVRASDSSREERESFTGLGLLRSQNNLLSLPKNDVRCREALLSVRPFSNLNQVFMEINRGLAFP